MTIHVFPTLSLVFSCAPSRSGVNITTTHTSVADVAVQFYVCFPNHMLHQADMVVNLMKPVSRDMHIPS